MHIFTIPLPVIVKIGWKTGSTWFTSYLLH